MQKEQAPILIDEPVFSSEIQKIIILGVIVVGVVVGVWYGWSSRLSSREDQAHQALVMVKSSEEKRKIADQFVGTQQAAFAYLNLANEKAQSNPQEALALYDLFLNKYPDHVLVNGAKIGKANVLESTQKPEEAIAIYQAVIQSRQADAYVPIALLNQARLQISQKQFSAARQTLQDLMVKYPTYKDEVKERLKTVPETKS